MDADRFPPESDVRSQLQIVRSQIKLYNVQNPATPYDETTPVGPAFWDRLLQGNYLRAEPINMLTPNPAVNDPSGVAAAPAVGGAWLWMESSPGDPLTLNMYAVDEDGNLYSDPDTGQPY